MKYLIVYIAIFTTGLPAEGTDMGKYKDFVYDRSGTIGEGAIPKTVTSECFSSWAVLSVLSGKDVPSLIET